MKKDTKKRRIWCNVPGKMDIKDSQRLKILSDQSLTPEDIIELIDITHMGSLYKFVKRMKNRGFLTSDSTLTYRHLTDLGKGFIKSGFSFFGEGVHPPKKGQISLNTHKKKTKKRRMKTGTVKPDLIRTHAVQFSIKPVGEINWKGKRFFSDLQVRKYDLKKYKTWKKDDSEIVDFWISNLRVQTNNVGIELFLPDIYGEDGRVVLDEAYMKVKEALPLLGRLFKTSFDKPNRVNIRLSKQELAIMRNELARCCKVYGWSSLTFCDDSGVKWGHLDCSKGEPEFEFTNVETADMDALQFKQWFAEMRDVKNFSPSTATDFLKSLTMSCLSAHKSTTSTLNLTNKLGELTLNLDNRLKLMENLFVDLGSKEKKDRSKENAQNSSVEDDYFSSNMYG